MMVRSIYIITILLDPSKALTTRVMTLVNVLFFVDFIRVSFGITFKDDLVSTRTFESILSWHLTDMCGSLLCAFPYGGNSLFLKLKQLLAVILATTPSN